MAAHANAKLNYSQNIESCRIPFVFGRVWWLGDSDSFIFILIPYVKKYFSLDQIGRFLPSFIFRFP